MFLRFYTGKDRNLEDISFSYHSQIEQRPVLLFNIENSGETHVSNLVSPRSQISFFSKLIRSKSRSYGCPTTNLVSPEAVPAAKPFARSVLLVLSFFGVGTGNADVEASGLICVAIVFCFLSKGDTLGFAIAEVR